MEMLLESEGPHFYIHVSQSSSFPPKGPSPTMSPTMSYESTPHWSQSEQYPIHIHSPESAAGGVLSDDEDSWLLPSFDHDRPILGTLMEVMVVDRTLGGRRLFLAVRALGRVRVTGVTQTLPHPRGSVEWEPDREEIEAWSYTGQPSNPNPSYKDGKESMDEEENEEGRRRAASAAGLLWAREYEVASRAGELSALSPLSAHIVDLARSFHELSPPVGSVEAISEAAWREGCQVLSPSPFPILPNLPTFAPLHAANAKVWELIRDIESLQLALSPPPPPPPSSPSSLGLPLQGLGVGSGQEMNAPAPAPVVARALKPILSPEMKRALDPLLPSNHVDGGEEEEGASPWPLYRWVRVQPVMS